MTDDAAMYRDHAELGMSPSVTSDADQPPSKPRVAGSNPAGDASILSTNRTIPEPPLCDLGTDSSPIVSQSPRRIYLAGGRDSGWRDALRDHWNGRAKIIDPFADCPQDYIHQFTGADLQAVAECDVLFGYSTFPRYTGMALEFGYAAALGKPIVYVVELPRVDSMMAGVSSAIFTSLDAAAEFVAERYL